jgi:hypothetical protein
LYQPPVPRAYVVIARTDQASLQEAFIYFVT